MHALYQAERSPIAQTQYQSFGLGKQFLKDNNVASESQIQQCAIVDLTNLPRVGFRGQDAAQYLNAYGFNLPDKPNQALKQEDGSWVARLSFTEYCVLGSLHDFGERVSQLEQGWKMDDTANYLLPRQDSHAWIQLTGQYVAVVMAKLCGVNLQQEEFAVGQIAQTSIARINAIVINVSDAQTHKFNLLCDRAAAAYLWEVLQDAIQEFKGEVVGIEGLL